MNRRLTLQNVCLLLAGVAVWTVLIVDVFSAREAQSYTPLINNVRRALNACQVLGRISQEAEQSGELAIKLNSRILCGQVDRQNAPGVPTADGRN